MNWTLIRHVPPALIVLPGEMPSDATDVEPYAERVCGEEIDLELLGSVRSPRGLLPSVRPSATELADWRTHTTAYRGLAESATGTSVTGKSVHVCM
jgi:hypothetical protein